MARIGFIGLGRMGSGMAARLLRAGHELRIYNRTPGRAHALEGQGARVCDSAQAAASDADAVIAMTADDDSSRAIWLGAQGALAAPRPAGGLVIECSTLSHGWVQELAQQSTGRGLRYIDAPVTGLPQDAAAGALTLLVGADPASLAAAHPILDGFASRVLRFGDVGAGTAYKLIINLVGAVQIASIAEAIAIAERAGLERATLAEAIATGQAASPQVVRNARKMLGLDAEEEVVFTAGLRLKDVSYALELAHRLGISAAFGEVAQHQLRRLCALGHAAANESRIVEVARS